MLNFETMSVDQLASLDQGAEFLPGELLQSSDKTKDKACAKSSVPPRKRKKQPIVLLFYTFILQELSPQHSALLKWKITNYHALAKYLEELSRDHPRISLAHLLPVSPDPSAHAFASIGEYEANVEKARPDQTHIPWDLLGRRPGCLEALFGAWLKYDRKLSKLLPLFQDLPRLWQFPTRLIDSYVVPSLKQTLQHKLLLKVRTQKVEKEDLIQLANQSAFWPDRDRFGVLVLNPIFFGESVQLPIFEDIIVPLSAKIDDETVWMEMRLTQRLTQLTSDALLAWSVAVATERHRDPHFVETANDQKAFFTVCASNQHWYEFEEPQDASAFNYAPDLANYFVPSVNRDIRIAKYSKYCKEIEETREQIGNAEANLGSLLARISALAEQDMNFIRLRAQILETQNQIAYLWKQHNKLELERACISKKF